MKAFSIALVLGLVGVCFAGTCTITTRLHQSGTPCLNGRTNNHIQVTTDQYTYHVFGYYEVVNGNRYRCATR